MYIRGLLLSKNQLNSNFSIKGYNNCTNLFPYGSIWSLAYKQGKYAFIRVHVYISNLNIPKNQWIPVCQLPSELYNHDGTWLSLNCCTADSGKIYPAIIYSNDQVRMMFNSDIVAETCMINGMWILW